MSPLSSVKLEWEVWANIEIGTVPLEQLNLANGIGRMVGGKIVCERVKKTDLPGGSCL